MFRGANTTAPNEHNEHDEYTDKDTERMPLLMSYVAINVLSVPEGQGDLLEGRFAGRAGMVEHSDGFESFELLRPSSGTSDYLVITRWRDEAAYRAWLESREFASGHGEQGRGGASAPAAMGSQIWTFETVQSAGN